MPTSSSPHVCRLRRTRVVAFIAVTAGVLAIGEAQQVTPQSIGSFAFVCVAITILMLANLSLYRIAARQILYGCEREDALKAAARDHAIACAANVMREQLANKLAVVIGYSEALADDEDQPAVVRQRAYKMLASAMAAGDVLHTLEERVASSGWP